MVLACQVFAPLLGAPLFRIWSAAFGRKSTNEQDSGTSLAYPLPANKPKNKTPEINPMN
jgi:hypothetical protein